MRALRRSTLVDNAANARLVETVEFTGDPHHVGQSVADEAGSRLQGRGGWVYVGDKGDPAQSFNGRTVTNQAFIGAAHLAHNPHVTRDPAGRDIATGVTDEGPFASTTQRIFAQRMARRGAL